MEMNTGSRLVQWNGLDWTKIKDGVKREVGVDAEEVEEHVGKNDEMMRCLRFTHGSACCLLCY